jgi:hypothetical protein
LPASITASPQTTPAKIDQDLRDHAGENGGRDRAHPDQQLGALVDAAAEPQPEHAPDLVGQEAREHQHHQGMPVAKEAAKEIAHARSLNQCTP